MRDRRPVDELSIEELERILAIRKREARQARLQKLGTQGRRVPLTAPLDAPPEPPPPPPQQHEPPGTFRPQSRRSPTTITETYRALRTNCRPHRRALPSR